MNYKNLIILGPAGSGKSSVSRLLAMKYDYCHISMGELLRIEINKKTSLGLQISEYYGSKILTPDSIVFKLVEQVVTQNTMKSGYVFDGFPRTEAQAAGIEYVLHNLLNTKINLVFIFDAPEDILVERIVKRKEFSNRLEDQDRDKVSNRVKYHLRETSWVDVARYFKNKSQIININTDNSLDKVFQILSSAIDDYSIYPLGNN